MTDNQDIDGRVHAIEEATLAIRNLSPEQMRRLERMTQRRAWHSGDYRALLSEAIAGTAEGRIRWKRNVDILGHLDMAMRDIASTAYERIETASGDIDSEVTRFAWQGCESSPEQVPEKRDNREELRKAVIARCEEDEDVKFLVEALLDGVDPHECVDLFGGRSKYEAVRKRMTRTIRKIRALGGIADQP